MRKRIKTNKWKFNTNYIFAQVVVFIKRCTKLKELCEMYLEFGKNGSNNKKP